MSFFSLILALSPAWAGDLEVRSVGAPVVVMLGGTVAGSTPFSIKDYPAGTVELGFRETPLGTTVFSQRVYVAATGTTVIEVNLPERAALPVVASAPASVATPLSPVSGDLYVVSTPAGAQIWVDGANTGFLAPAMLRAVAVGKHIVQLRTECTRAEAEVTVANGVISRAELSPLPGAGSISVASGPPNARLLIDGTEVGKLPATINDLACGDHILSLRAPGFLEAQKTVRVAAFDSLAVELPLRKEEFGTLVLDVVPLDTIVTVDGTGVGAGPRTLDKIGVGPHKVSGTLEGYTARTVDVTVPPNEVARLNLTLEKVGEPDSALAAVSAADATEKSTQKKASGAKVSATTPRIVLNVAVSAVGLAAVSVGALSFVEQYEAFTRYQTVESDADAERIYVQEVQPAAARTYIAGGIGVAALAAGTGLWITTEF